MNKVIRPGTVPVGGRRASVFCRIEHESRRLSITGVIGPTAGGNALGSCGQINTEFKHYASEHDDKRYGHLIGPEEINYAPGWGQHLWLSFLDVWRTWHLNDMRDGCEHQRRFGWRYETHNGLRCPICGFEIGTLWLREEVPQDVLDWLASLPDADKKPAWV